jgi:hypothetical protein
MEINKFQTDHLRASNMLWLQYTRMIKNQIISQCALALIRKYRKALGAT